MPSMGSEITRCKRSAIAYTSSKLAAKTTAKGVLIAQEMAIQASRIKPQQCDAGDIVLGLECGSSDTTSGLAANPALGVVVEQLVAENAVAIGAMKYLGVL